MYKLNYYIDGKVIGIIRESDGACIPICEGNTDYKDFLIWNAEQHPPLDLNSTIPVIPPAPARDLAAEITALQKQVSANTSKIATLEKIK